MPRNPEHSARIPQVRDDRRWRRRSPRTDRGLRHHRRLRDRGARVSQRIDRLALLAALRFRRVLRRAARHGEERPLAARAVRRTDAHHAPLRGDTLILETTYETTTGVVTVIDFMPMRDGTSNIVRTVIGRAAQVDDEDGDRAPLRLRRRSCRGSAGSTTERLRAIAGPDMVTIRSDVELHGRDFTTVGEFVVERGRAKSRS